jgi:PAS domain S-box-containing protein
MIFFSTLIKAIALFCYIVLVLFTVRSKAEKGLRRFFFLYLFGMIYWQFTSLLINLAHEPRTAILLYNLLFAGSGMFNVLFLPFSRAFLGIKGQRVWTVLAYLMCAVMLTLGILQLQFSDVYLGRAGYYVPRFNSVSLYVQGVVGYFLWGLGVYNLVRGLAREKSPLQRNRIRYVLLGAMVVIVGTVSNFTVLRDYPVDISANLVAALLMGYAVVRHRLLDIRVILVRSLLYSALTALVIAVYLGVVVGVEGAVQRRFGYTSPLFGVIAILLLAVVFLPVRNLFQRILDKLFFREKYDYQKVTQSFSREVASVYDPVELLALVESTIGAAMKVDRFAVALLDEDRKIYSVEKHFGMEADAIEALALSEQGSLVKWLRKEALPLLREEASINPRLREPLEDSLPALEKAEIRAVVPILLKDRLLGFLGLGSKRAGTMYNDEDLRFLTTIANQAATALEKAAVYREIERRLSEQTLLFILSERLRGSTDFDAVMRSVVRILKNFLRYEHCAIVCFEGEAHARIYALDPASQAAAEGLRSREDLVQKGSDPLSPFVYLPLHSGENALGALLLPRLRAGQEGDKREGELLGTIQAIVSQGIVLQHTIVNLVSVKTYNENILNSLNDMGDLLVILDLEGRIRRVNRAICQRLGYREEELLGREAGLIVGGGESLFTGAGFRRLIEEGTVAGYEMTYCTRDGTAIPMLVSGSVVTGEDGVTREIVCIGRDLSEHLKAEEMAKNLLLVQEIHHRIKNNLQVISSLLYLQSGYVQDEKTREMFKESQNRVRSMALLHEKLYQSRTIAGIHFSEYVRDLTRTLFGSYGVEGTTVRVTYAVEDITLGMDTAVPCGLIINELVSNALKHAFPPGRTGEVRIQMASLPDRGADGSGESGTAERWYQLCVSDDGSGFPDGIDFRHTESLGLKLVCTLTEQLSGTIALQRDSGTRFTIKFREL